MPINPADISTIRVGELPLGAINVDSNIPVENDTVLEQITGQQLLDFVAVNAFQYEIRDLWVNQTYIDTYFDGTGLGTGIHLGWAICNGQNGTPPMDGLVSIGYGNNYSVIGAFGGSKDAVLVSHTHSFSASEDDTANNGNFLLVSPTDFIGVKTNVLSTEGVSGTNKNMQPYIVLLKIMKL